MRFPLGEAMEGWQKTAAACRVLGIGWAIFVGASDVATFICVKVDVSGLPVFSRSRRNIVMHRAFTTSRSGARRKADSIFKNVTTTVRSERLIQQTSGPTICFLILCGRTQRIQTFREQASKMCCVCGSSSIDLYQFLLCHLRMNGLPIFLTGQERL